MDFDALKKHLQTTQYKWLVTGVAGFIGSNILEKLLTLNQKVVGLDNFSTGYQRNLDQVEALVTKQQWANFQFHQGDICSVDDCEVAVAGVDYVIHQAALGSVPRSIETPLLTHASNLTGFLNLLTAAKDAGVKRCVYASSSAVYGDHPQLPKVESEIGQPLSPYAVTKYANELYAGVFSRCYGLETMGLRYFNVFGARQDPEGAYAAVIPKWVGSLLKDEPVYINGDGETSRDFTYIANVVQANLLAATTDNSAALNQVYNVAMHQRTTLNDLFFRIRDLLAQTDARFATSQPVYRDFRSGDIRHSLADITKTSTLIGYKPTITLEDGLPLCMDWYKALYQKAPA